MSNKTENRILRHIDCIVKTLHILHKYDIMLKFNENRNIFSRILIVTTLIINITNTLYKGLSNPQSFIFFVSDDCVHIYRGQRCIPEILQ